MLAYVKNKMINNLPGSQFATLAIFLLNIQIKRTEHFEDLPVLVTVAFHGYRLLLLLYIIMFVKKVTNQYVILLKSNERRDGTGLQSTH